MFRQNYNTQKPENVLNRVNELIASSTGPNADKEKQFALEQLHMVISSSRRKQWSKVYEAIMCKHMELCVDLKDNRLAKDGLHQYRNMVHNIDPNSLENVIVHLLDLAEGRANAAREKANKVSLAAAAKVSDLDQAETPESIMLSTMTIEGVKDRTDREVVVPWLKFLWDAYRAVLELLHKNSKLEKAYLKTCEKAFHFCQDYQRTLEFKRLCDMLRQQLLSIQRFASQPARSNRSAWEWTAESIEIQLQIRFNQLEVATALEQWNEGFRTVEDIYQIMQLSKKPPKPRLMAAYYEKLTRIFWVSENLLFHAYAWFKYYTLCCECRKDMKPEDKAMLASNTVLAALCAPEDKRVGSANGSSHVNRSFDDSTVLNEKNQQMASLLGFRAHPCRSALLAELVAKGVLGEVIPELKNLYANLENKFHPLSLIKDMIPIVSFVKSHPQLHIYAKPLQKVSALRTVMQLSKVYSTMRISSLTSLFSLLDYSYVEIEDILCDSINKNQISMQIDHSSGCYRFGPRVSVAPVVENQLTDIGRALKNVTSLIAPMDESNAIKLRQSFLQSVKMATKNQHLELQERKSVIERRKEGLERLVRERERDEIARKYEEEEARRREEQDRLEKEEDERRNEKLKAQQDLMHIKRIKMEVEALGKEVDEDELRAMDEKSRNEVLANAQQEVRKAKEDEVKRLAEQAKVLDYITRAIRIEAGKKVEISYRKQEAIDKAAYDVKLAQAHALQKEKHESLLAAKMRLGKLSTVRSSFEAMLIEKQRSAYAEKVKAAKKAAWDTHRAQKISRARYAKSEEEDRLYEEQERERERAQEEELARLQAKQHEELRLQREQELEALRRQEEEEKESLRTREEEARLRVVPVNGDADRYPNDEKSLSGDGGGWQRQGPPGRMGGGGDRGGRDYGFGKDGGRDRDSFRDSDREHRRRDGEFGFGSRGGPPSVDVDADRYPNDQKSSGADGGEWLRQGPPGRMGGGGDRGGGRDYGFGKDGGRDYGFGKDRGRYRDSDREIRENRGRDDFDRDRRSGGGDEGRWRRF